MPYFVVIIMYYHVKIACYQALTSSPFPSGSLILREPKNEERENKGFYRWEYEERKKMRSMFGLSFIAMSASLSSCSLPTPFSTLTIIKRQRTVY